jgi:hypothetical protein
MMVERVGFATRGCFMDEFYLPEDVIEWLGLKKSEYLSKLIENVQADDFQFEEYHQFEDLISSTISLPDWSVEVLEDDRRIKTYYRLYSDEKAFYQVISGLIVEDQNKNDVFVPILSFVTRHEELVKIFCGGKMNRPLLN